MEDNVIELYKQLSLENQRNELSDLLIKIDNLLDTLIANNNLNHPDKVKNYNINLGSKLSEGESLAFFYEDIWLIKNKILMLLTLDSIDN